jgi:ankyrin repeat protein
MWLLIAARADPNLTPLADVTPLMISAENGLTEAVSELLRAKADPHLRNSQGETALLAAARTNNHDAFAVLVGSMVSAPPAESITV